MKNYLNNRFIYILGTIVILIILMITMKFSYTIKMPCQIVGQKEWALIQVEPDKIISKIYDNGEDTDLWALNNNFVSIVPSSHDLTNYKALDKFKFLAKDK